MLQAWALSAETKMYYEQNYSRSQPSLTKHSMHAQAYQLTSKQKTIEILKNTKTVPIKTLSKHLQLMQS